MRELMFYPTTNAPRDNSHFIYDRAELIGSNYNLNFV